jgi:hypothetical protein
MAIEVTGHAIELDVDRGTLPFADASSRPSHRGT